MTRGSAPTPSAPGQGRRRPASLAARQGRRSLPAPMGGLCLHRRLCGAARHHRHGVGRLLHPAQPEQPAAAGRDQRLAQPGMLVVILTGGIDLSVGSVVALAAVMVSGMSKEGMPLPLAILVCLVVGDRRRGRQRVLHCPLQAAAVHRHPGDDGQPFAGLVFVYSDIPITPTDPAFRAVLGAGFIGPVSRSRP